MSNTKIKYTNLGYKNDSTEDISSLPTSSQNHIHETTSCDLKLFFEEDPNIFILNNILISVQFFENYERDIKILRENWFKDIILNKHYSKCFVADSIHRVVGENVNFKECDGTKKRESEELLHPQRVFITNYNVEAAYNPSALGRNEPKVLPHYQLTVTPCESNKKERHGYVFLYEHKTFEPPKDDTNEDSTEGSHPPLEDDRVPTRTNIYRKSIFDPTKSSRRLTKTEQMIGLQNKEVILRQTERNSFLKGDVRTPEGTIPHNGYYHYVKPEARLKPKPIYNYRMDNIPQKSYEIPRSCFQTIYVKQAVNLRKRTGLRRSLADHFFRTRNILNSAAFKAHFCDVLIENLAEQLKFDPEAIHESTVHEDYVTYQQNGILNHIAPVIEIRDWNQHLEINKRTQINETSQLSWPTDEMKEIMRILPCNLLPNGYSEQLEENPDYEKEWKITFPKAEEFLLMHLMHSHLRCYLFALAIYKSFIELEINSISFNSTHLLHLLFWRVQKDFLGWPEDRPAETLINFLKALYRKLRNKRLYDFFLTSRNLFARSLPKDLHKVQFIIKMILENPIPYIMRVVRNLNSKPNFYVKLDILKFNEILTKSDKTDAKIKTQVSLVKKAKRVTFAEDEEKWRKDVIKQIQIERKSKEEQEQTEKSDINTEEILNIDTRDSVRCREIFHFFISHFLQMGSKSIEYEVPNQALMYFFHSQNTLDLLLHYKLQQKEIDNLRTKINQLQERCEKLMLKNQTKQQTEALFTLIKSQNRKQGKKQEESVKVNEKVNKVKEEIIIKLKEKEEESLSDDNSDDVKETKL